MCYWNLGVKTHTYRGNFHAAEVKMNVLQFRTFKIDPGPKHPTFSLNNKLGTQNCQCVYTFGYYIIFDKWKTFSQN